MTNNLSDYQKEVFFDIYKTSLNAFLSTKEFGEFSIEEIEDAIKVAMNTVDLITDEHGLRKPLDIIKTLEDEKYLSTLDFPHIEE